MNTTEIPECAGSSQTAQNSLKRRASSSLENIASGSSRKKLKETMSDPSSEHVTATPEAPINGELFADELEQELQCGCCSALVYRPVVVYPCQHFFCGR